LQPDHVAIANLVATYAEHIDAGDFAAVGALFAHGAITGDAIPGEVRGAEAVQQMYEQWTRRYDDGTPRTHHVMTNLIIEVDDQGATAAGRTYFTVFQQTPELPLQPIVAGRYVDRFERVDGTWRFAARHIAVRLSGDVSHHLLQSMEASG
jgi:ketosteroid isomerase-like protein